MKQFSDHEGDVLDSLLGSRKPVINPHTVVKLPTALVYHCVEEGEGRIARIRRDFERQIVDDLAPNTVEVWMVLFIHGLKELSCY
jgi:hypothetical protein